MKKSLAGFLLASAIAACAPKHSSFVQVDNVALGLKISDTFALGFSIQGAYSRNPDLNGLFGVTAGATFRPNARSARARRSPPYRTGTA